MNSIFEKADGFAWDKGNLDKNKKKHKVDNFECEEVFFNRPILIFQDEKHSKEESRHFVLGRTFKNRKLFIVFTMRNNKIRIISARNMSKKEKEVYEKA